MHSFRSGLFAVLCLFAATVSCRKHEPGPSVPPAINAIKVKSAGARPVLIKELEGSIQSDSIYFYVPEGINLNDVILSCDYQGGSLYVNGAPVTTAEIRVQLSDLSRLSVVAPSGEEIVYTLALNNYHEEALVVDSFVVEKSKNPDLLEDIVFRIKDDTIFGALRSHITSFLPTITTKATEILVNRQPFDSATIQLTNAGISRFSLVSANGFRKSYVLAIEQLPAFPHVFINTENSLPVVSKETYLKADLLVDGVALFSNYTGPTSIKGRGNSTFTFPKKPYRLKLDKKASLFGLPEAKNWVLLANYLDEVHMLNAVAFKIGELLHMPYINHSIPVEVTLNGMYQGLYQATEQLEEGENRVAVGKDGWLLELDEWFDEDWRFRTSHYELPVMVKHPELESAAEMVPMQELFQQLEDALLAPDFPENQYRDLIDLGSAADFILANLITDNGEVDYPKSTYMHKKAGGKLHFGPLWDFDFGFGYPEYPVGGKHFIEYDNPLFNRPEFHGSVFFSRLLEDPQLKQLLKDKWQAFKQDGMPQLKAYLDNYSAAIADARARDVAVWQRGDEDFTAEFSRLDAWIKGRVYYIDQYLSVL